jgi:hypothetical protein
VLHRQHTKQIPLVGRGRNDRAQHVAAHGPQHPDYDVDRILHRVEQVEGGLYVAPARILLENGARSEADNVCHAVRPLPVSAATIGRCCAVLFVGDGAAIERAYSINNQIKRGLLVRAVRKYLEKT